MEIEKIYLYPVKSLRPVSVESAVIGRHGLLHDRMFMLLKVHRRVGTSEVDRLENMQIGSFPNMCLFLASLETDDGPNSKHPTKVVVTYMPPKSTSSGEPRLSNEDDKISFPLQPPTDLLDTIQVDMYNSPTAAYNMGAPYNNWFSSRFGYEVILAFIGSNSRAVLGNLSPNATNGVPAAQSATSSLLNTLRSIIPLPKVAIEDRDDPRIGFQDCAQFLFVTEESLADVSARLPAETPMDVTKFRPNIVLSGAKGGAWAEDYWAELSIMDDNGNVDISLTANCVRCQSINVDYTTGAPGTDEAGSVLKKLQKDRRVDAGAKYSPCFGRYGFAKGNDVGRGITVGMKVDVTKVNRERTKFEWPGL